jgi:hypothetical protein
MKIIFAALICAAAARAQAVDPAAAALRKAEKTPAAARAIDGLRKDASSDGGSKEVFAALFDVQARAALEKRLAPGDSDGALRAELEILAKAATDPAKARAAAGAIDDKDLDGGRPGGPVDEPEGFSQNGAVDAGAVSAGGRTSPAFKASGEVDYKKGPYEAGLEFSGLVAPNGGRNPGVYSLDASLQRKLGDSKNFVFAEAEGERDELLGVSFSRSLRVGLGRDIVDDARQTLTATVSAGPNVEGTFAGTDRFISPAIGVDYAFHLNPALTFVEKLEGEFNAKDHADIEYASVTALVWKLSEKLSVQAVYDLKGRTEQVYGYAKSRATKLIGLHYDF